MKISSDGDNFFKDEEGILAVYDFDYEAATDFNYKVATRSTLCVACAVPYCWPCLPCAICFVFLPMFRDNVQDATEAQHLAISRDGIKYVVERHKSGCRLDCQDIGKVSKTVPFDKITDCDVAEPAGASGPCCCLVKNVLYTVNVDTASGNRGENGTNGHELVLSGLKDPHRFKKDVWSMKRGEGIAGNPNSAGMIIAPSAVLMDDRMTTQYVSSSSKGKSSASGGLVMSGEGEKRLIKLMEEQNELIKKQNQILKEGFEK